MKTLVLHSNNHNLNMICASELRFYKLPSATIYAQKSLFGKILPAGEHFVLRVEYQKRCTGQKIYLSIHEASAPPIFSFFLLSDKKPLTESSSFPLLAEVFSFFSFFQRKCIKVDSGQGCLKRTLPTRKKIYRNSYAQLHFSFYSKLFRLMR